MMSIRRRGNGALRYIANDSGLRKAGAAVHPHYRGSRPRARDWLSPGSGPAAHTDGTLRPWIGLARDGAAQARPIESARRRAAKPARSRPALVRVGPQP